MSTVTKHLIDVRPATVVPPDEQVQALAKRLNNADTVALFCGAGVAGAYTEVMDLAARAKVRNISHPAIVR